MVRKSEAPKTVLTRIFEAGLSAVEPRQAVLRHLRLQENALQIGDRKIELDAIGRIFVFGAGKACGPMAAAVEDILGERLSGGMVIVKYGHGCSLRKIAVHEAGHPVPDEAGLRAGALLVDRIRQLKANDLFLFLISGGGSALLPVPAEGVSLADKMEATRELLRCGATIGEINTVRKHLSKTKGGGLAKLAAPAKTASLILSDVVGDPLDVIASGPTVADPSTFADALQVIERYALRETIADSVLNRLERGAAQEIAETPKPGAAFFADTINQLIATNALAVEAAAREASRRGYTPIVLTTTLTGETREVAKMHVAIAREVRDHRRPESAPLCLISGGETTVTIRGRGKGGRNQEFALAAAVSLEGEKKIAVLAGGTDGTDGPTDAAGAFADGSTLARARSLGLEGEAHLAENNAYPLFSALEDLLMTGPTGTNVMDLYLLSIDS